MIKDRLGTKPLPIQINRIESSLSGVVDQSKNESQVWKNEALEPSGGTKKFRDLENFTKI